MENKKRNKPKRRFAGFTDDWEERKLGEVAEIVGGGTPNTNTPEYWDGDIDWYVPAEINDQIFADGSERKITKLGLEKSSAKILPKYKTVLFTSRAGIGKMAILRRSGATNQGFQSMVLNDETNSYFVFSMGDLIKDKAERVASGSTFTEISGKLLENLDFMFPTKLEQEKIGAYFRNFDHLITLHQRKLDKLGSIKKSYLSEMFPQEGEKKPKRRFKGFTDDWEKRKLGEIGKSTGGISIESEFSENGIYKVVSIGSYSENSIYNDQGLRAVESDKTRDRVLNKGDITMILNDKTSSGNIIGRVLLIEESGIYVYNQRTERIEINTEKYDSLFIYEMLNAPEIREKIVKQSQGNTQIYVNWSVISSTEYYIPEKKEQMKIGEFFHTLDHLITLHQRKLEKLKNIKQAYLNEMFV